MNKGMNLPERLKFCLEATIFKKTDEETLDILRNFKQTTPSFQLEKSRSMTTLQQH